MQICSTSHPEICYCQDVCPFCERNLQVELKLSELNKTQALCHCGEYMKDHGYFQNHSGVEMKETCPYSIDLVETKRKNLGLQAEIDELRGKLQDLETEVPNQNANPK